MRFVTGLLIILFQLTANAQLLPVKDIHQGNASSMPFLLTQFKNQIYFIVKDDSGKYSLWKTSGTTYTTKKIIQLETDNTFSYNQTLIASSKYLYFINFNINSNESTIWRTDGTLEGTIQLVESVNNLQFNSDNLVLLNDELYYTVYKSGIATQIWKTDGTINGAKQVTNIPYQSFYHRPKKLFVHNGQLFFTYNANKSVATQIWKLDNSAAGASMFADFEEWGYYEPMNFTSVDSLLFFTMNQSTTGIELYVTDGTTQGTRMVIDFYPGPNSSNPNLLTALNSRLYLAFQSSNQTLYSTDGTAKGTEILSHNNEIFSRVSNIKVINHLLYFQARHTNFGEEAFVSNGKVDSTILIADIISGIRGSFPYNFCDCGDRIYFNTKEDNQTENLWMLKNNKVQRIQSVSEINASAFPRYFGCFFNEYYTANFSDQYGIELHRTWNYGPNEKPLDFNNFIYPNPCSDFVYLAPKFFLYIQEFEFISITNLSGQTMAKFNPEEVLLSRLDISGLSSGVYIVKVHTKSGVKLIQKIVVVN